MKTFHLLLILSLTGAVLLAGCAGDDDGGESTTGDQTGRELSTDVMVEGGDDTTADTNTTTNETETNTTSSG